MCVREGERRREREGEGQREEERRAEQRQMRGTEQRGTTRSCTCDDSDTYFSHPSTTLHPLPLVSPYDPLAVAVLVVDEDDVRECGGACPVLAALLCSSPLLLPLLSSPLLPLLCSSCLLLAWAALSLSLALTRAHTHGKEEHRFTGKQNKQRRHSRHHHPHLPPLRPLSCPVPSGVCVECESDGCGGG